MTTLWAWCLRNHSSLLRWRKQFSSSPKLPYWLLGPPNPVFNGYRRLFPLVKRDWGMKLITHHHSESRIRLSAAILALFHNAFMACRGMLLFTQKCGKLYSTSELIYFPNITCGFKYLVPHCSLTADRNIRFKSYTWYIKPDFIFSVCHSTFNV